MSRTERINVSKEIAELRRENEQLRQTVRELIARGNAQQKKVEVPESSLERESPRPPWEREGLSKKEWLAKKKER